MWWCNVNFCVMSCLLLASASVMYLHSKSIAHSDLKAANILIDGTGAARVADFGVRLPFPPIMICARAMPVLRYLYHLSAPSHLICVVPLGRANRPHNRRQLHERRLKGHGRVHGA